MRTVPRMTRYLSCMAAALFIAGCGGGGGGGGSSSAGGSTPVPPPNTPATLSVSSNTIAATASTAQSAPSVGFSVQITTTVSTSTEFYVNGSYTKHGIASISEDSTAGNFTIVFQSPAALGVGTYQDTITLEACYQSACSQQVTGSPQVIAVTYTVTQGAASLTSLNPATVQAAVAFTLTVDGSGFLSSSVIVFNGTPVSTTYLSPTQITAAISAAAINQPGTVWRGGGTLACRSRHVTVEPARAHGLWAAVDHQPHAELDRGRIAGVFTERARKQLSARCHRSVRRHAASHDLGG